MSHMSCAEAYIISCKNGGASSILQTDVLKHVSKVTGSTMEQVRGTIASAVKGLRDPEIQKKLGIRCMRRPTRYVFNNEKPTLIHSYDCPEKSKIRDEIVQVLRNANTPHNPDIVTLASNQGLCVKRFLEAYPLANIYNVESDNNIFKEYKTLKLKTKDFNSSFSDFYSVYAEKGFDLIYYDSCSYMCKTTYHDLEMINAHKNVNIIVLTQMDIDRFRNTGKWVTWAKSMFGYTREEKPTDKCLSYVLNNYKLLDVKKYKKSNVVGARRMRVYFFKLKGD